MRFLDGSDELAFEDVEGQFSESLDDELLKLEQFVNYGDGSDFSELED